MKKLTIFLCLLLVVTISGCTSEDKNNNVCDLDCDSADMSAYENFENKDDIYKEISMEDSLEILQGDETAVVYYGFAACPWCQEIVPILNDAAKDANFNVYYVNVREKEKDTDIRNDDNEAYKQVYNIVEEYLTDKEKLSVPDVFFIKNGKIVGNHEGTFDDHDAHERKMTKAEQKKLRKIYDDLFDKIK